MVRRLKRDVLTQLPKKRRQQARGGVRRRVVWVLARACLPGAGAGRRVTPPHTLSTPPPHTPINTHALLPQIR